MPRKLSSKFVERIWGSTELEPWYPNPRIKTGEVWLETVPELPLLVKFIFTTEALSIQVHPNDEQARAAGHTRGKTEMWAVLRAAPGAVIGVGLRAATSHQRLRAACESGEIEQLLDWKPTRAGDVILVRAGTIHAIGAGIVLCEIQQDSDVTYRLYDYGRPRTLHLDQGIEVSHPVPHAGVTRPRKLGERVSRLAECEYFVTDEMRAPDACTVEPNGEHPLILVAIEGEGQLAGEPYRAGEAWLLEAREGAVPVEPRRPTRFLRTFAP